MMYESAFAVAINSHPLSVEEAKQISHDTVISNTGEARCSGVSWTICDVSLWREALNELEIVVDHNRHLTLTDIEMSALQHPDGLLVIATVEVED